MKNVNFVKGIGLGMLAGAMLSTLMMPRRKSLKSSAGKAIKAAGEVVDSITSAMGM